MSFRFTIDGLPVPKERPRVVVGAGRRAFTYTPSRTREFERLVSLLALQARGRARKIDGPVSVQIVCEVGPEPVVHVLVGEADAEVAAIGRADLDNIAKSILDAMNGVLYDDDRQVTDLEVRRRKPVD